MLGLQGCAWQTQACRPPECEPPAVLPGEMLLPLTFTSRTESFSSDIDLHRPPSCRAFRRSTPAVATCTGRLGGKRSVATHWIPLLGLRRLKDNFLTICKLWFSIYIYLQSITLGPDRCLRCCKRHILPRAQIHVMGGRGSIRGRAEDVFNSKSCCNEMALSQFMPVPTLSDQTWPEHFFAGICRAARPSLSGPFPSVSVAAL